MLFDRGPITPIDVDAWTRPGPRTTFALDAAPLGVGLHGARATLDARLSVMATAAAPLVDGGAGADLNDAIVAHAGQPSDPDPAIGAIAGNADAQGSAIVGLSNDAATAIAQAQQPASPPYVSHGPDPSWKSGDGNAPPPGGKPPGTPGPTWPVEATQFLSAEFSKFYRRNVLPDEWDLWLPTWPDADTIERAILNSDEYAADVNKLYHDYFRRSVEGDELADARNNKWSLDDVEANLQSRS